MPLGLLLSVLIEFRAAPPLKLKSTPRVKLCSMEAKRQAAINCKLVKLWIQSYMTWKLATLDMSKTEISPIWSKIWSKSEQMRLKPQKSPQICANCVAKSSSNHRINLKTQNEPQTNPSVIAVWCLGWCLFQCFSVGNFYCRRRNRASVRLI